MASGQIRLGQTFRRQWISKHKKSLEYHLRPNRQLIDDLRSKKLLNDQQKQTLLKEDTDISRSSIILEVIWFSNSTKYQQCLEVLSENGNKHVRSFLERMHTGGQPTICTKYEQIVSEHQKILSYKMHISTALLDDLYAEHVINEPLKQLIENIQRNKCQYDAASTLFDHLKRGSEEHWVKALKSFDRNNVGWIANYIRSLCRFTRDDVNLHDDIEDNSRHESHLDHDNQAAHPRIHNNELGQPAKSPEVKLAPYVRPRVAQSVSDEIWGIEMSKAREKLGKSNKRLSTIGTSDKCSLICEENCNQRSQFSQTAQLAAARETEGTSRRRNVDNVFLIGTAHMTNPFTMYATKWKSEQCLSANEMSLGNQMQSFDICQSTTALDTEHLSSDSLRHEHQRSASITDDDDNESACESDFKTQTKKSSKRSIANSLRSLTETITSTIGKGLRKSWTLLTGLSKHGINANSDDEFCNESYERLRY